jgi:hypothetical protein
MIDQGWFDHEFVRRWTNGPLLIRSDTGRLLRASDVSAARTTRASSRGTKRPPRQPSTRPSEGVFGEQVALLGTFDVATADGIVPCRTVFDRARDMCARYSPDAVAAHHRRSRRSGGCGGEKHCGSPGPTAFYSWSGVEQHTGTTQTARAINLVYALTGSFDVEGGNVLFTAPKVMDISGAELLSKDQRGKALGLADRPLGGARFGFVTSGDIYRAIPGPQSLRRAGHGELRFEPPRRPRRWPTRSRGDRRPRLPRARRCLHEPDGGVG